jgi:hypothetical protein
VATSRQAKSALLTTGAVCALGGLLFIMWFASFDAPSASLWIVWWMFPLGLLIAFPFVSGVIPWYIHGMWRHVLQALTVMLLVGPVFAPPEGTWMPAGACWSMMGVILAQNVGYSGVSADEIVAGTIRSAPFWAFPPSVLVFAATWCIAIRVDLPHATPPNKDDSLSP